MKHYSLTLQTARAAYSKCWDDVRTKIIALLSPGDEAKFKKARAKYLKTLKAKK